MSLRIQTVLCFLQQEYIFRRSLVSSCDEHGLENACGYRKWRKLTG